MNESDLLALAQKSTENDLAFLLRAKEDAKRRVKDDPSHENINAFNKAKTALEAEMAKSQQSQPVEIFTNILAVEKYLTSAGWKVKKSKLYQDKKKGLLKVQPDGTVLKFDADTYAAANLAPSDAAPDADDQETLKLKRELLRVELETKRQIQERTVMRLQRERGDLLSREELDNTLVAFVTVLRASLRQFFYMLTPQLVEIVRGDPSRIEEAIHFELNKSNEFWNGFAKARDFDVVDDEDEEPAPHPDTEDAA